MKIAILLPENPDHGWIWRARQLALALGRTRDPEGGSIEVAVGLPREAEPSWRRKEADIRQGAPHIVVRHLGWERVATDLAQRMYPGRPVDLDGIGEVALPRDWGWNFVDCDAWIVCADPALGAVMPLKPTAYYVRDLAARYVPDAFAGGLADDYWRREAQAFRLWRQSAAVFAADPATLDDISSYAGVRRDRILQCPQLRPTEGVYHNQSSRDSTLLWLAEPNVGHDVAAALEGLRLYQAEGGGMKVVIAGDQAYGFDPREGQAALAAVPVRSRRSTLDAAFETIDGARAMSRLLGRVDLIWSSALADGENEGVLRAAQAGVPFVGLRYPQSERLADLLGVSAYFYDASDPGLIADAIAEAGASLSGRSREVLEIKPEKTRRWASILERLWGAAGV